MTEVRYVDISGLDDPTYERLYQKASEDRKARADRYYSREDSQRCIVADGLIRYMTRQAFGLEGMTVERTAEGKPYLKDRENFHFSLSHSGRWVAIAWGPDPVGIDVERFRRKEKVEGIARRFFRDDEQSYLFSAEGQEWTQRFFEIWTKKESYLKVRGSGLAYSLNAFSVMEPQTLDVTFTGWVLDDGAMALCSTDSQVRICRLSLDQI